MTSKSSRKQKKEAKKLETKKKDDRFFKSYSSLSYRLFGSRFESSKNEKLESRLRMANMPITPAVYMSMQIVSAVIAFGVSFMVCLLVMPIIVGPEDFFIWTLGMSGLATGAILLVLPIAVSMRISNRKSQIDHELPFTLSELSILASTGLSPVEVFRRMSQRKVNEVMAGEFRRIVFKIDVEGKDIITALGEAAKESPSNTMRETLWDLSNMIHQGGDLDQYLRLKADEIMNLKRAIQKEFIDKLTTLSDIYVSLVLIGVLFIAIAAFLIDALGSDFGGMDANTLLLVLSYFIIPVAVVAVAMLVSSAYAKAE